MEIESLFSSTRWEILKSLSSKPKSPMELAKAMQTTSANISQQLRLLELAGLVKSERTSNVDKGKPRIIYSVSGDNAFLIMATANFADKKMLALTKYHKFMMRTWFLPNAENHVLLAQLYLKIQDNLDSIDVISVDTSHGLTVHIGTSDLKLKEKIRRDLSEMKLKIVVNTSSNLQKNLTILYDQRNPNEVEKNE